MHMHILLSSGHLPMGKEQESVLGETPLDLVMRGFPWMASSNVLFVRFADIPFS